MENTEFIQRFQKSLLLFSDFLIFFHTSFIIVTFGVYCQSDVIYNDFFCAKVINSIHNDKKN